MAEVDVVAKDVRVYEFPHVLLLVVTTDSLVLELPSDLRHLLIHYLLLLVFSLAVSNVSNVE